MAVSILRQRSRGGRGGSEVILYLVGVTGLLSPPLPPAPPVERRSLLMAGSGRSYGRIASPAKFVFKNIK